MERKANETSSEGEVERNAFGSDPVQDLLHRVFLPYVFDPVVLDDTENVATEETNERQEEETCIVEEEIECKEGTEVGLESIEIVGWYETRALRLCDAVDRLLQHLPLQDSHFSERCRETDANGEPSEQDVSETWNVVDQTIERLEEIVEAFQSEAKKKERTSVENVDRVKSRWNMVRKFAILSFGGALVMRLLESKKKRKNRLRRKKEHARRAQNLKNNHMGMSRKKELLVDRYPPTSSDG